MFKNDKEFKSFCSFQSNHTDIVNYENVKKSEYGVLYKFDNEYVIGLKLNDFYQLKYEDAIQLKNVN